MSRHSTSNLPFLTLATLVVIGSAAAIALAWIPARAYAAAQSRRLVADGQSADGAEARVDFALAVKLDSGNVPARLGLATAQIAAGQASAALITLDRAGQGSEVTRLRVRTQLELGRASESLSQISSLTGPGHTDDDVILAAEAYALGDRPSDIPALIPLVSAPETAGRLRRLQQGQLPLATELYASGLPESSSAILLKLPTSFERNVLLARLAYARHTAADLASATDYLTGAVALNPADVAAHRLLATVFTDRHMPAEAAAQSDLADRLQAGRP